MKRDRALSKIFETKQLRGGLFEKGMYSDLTGEGWDDPAEIRPEYKPSPERQIDGVLMVTSSCPDDYKKSVEDVVDRFEDEGVVKIVATREGNARPGVNKGREQYVLGIIFQTHVVKGPYF